MSLTLPDTLTMERASAALAALQGALRGAGSGPVALDASGLRTFDTSAVAVLLELAREAQGRGQALTVNGTPENLRALAALYGVDGLLTLA